MQNAKLKVVDPNPNSESRQDFNALLQLVLVIDWIDPELVHVARCITDGLHSHQRDMMSECQIAANVLRQFRQPWNRQCMKNDTDFNINPVPGELMKSHNRLVKSAIGLNHVIMYRGIVGVERDAEAESWMADGGEL